MTFYYESTSNCTHAAAKKQAQVGETSQSVKEPQNQLLQQYKNLQSRNILAARQISSSSEHNIIEMSPKVIRGIRDMQQCHFPTISQGQSQVKEMAQVSAASPKETRNTPFYHAVGLQQQPQDLSNNGGTLIPQVAVDIRQSAGYYWNDRKYQPLSPETTDYISLYATANQ